MAPERVGELGGDTVLDTAMGQIVVPEGAYKVTQDCDYTYLVQCSIGDPLTQYSTYYMKARAIAKA